MLVIWNSLCNEIAISGAISGARSLCENLASSCRLSNHSQYVSPIIPNTILASATGILLNDTMNILSPIPKSTKRLPVVTPKTTRIVDLPNNRKGTNINDLTIQVAVLNAACEFMGTDLWKYSKNSGRSYHRRVELLQFVRDASRFMISYRTLMRWIDYFQKYGEAPAKAKRNRRPTMRQLQSQEEGLFTEHDEMELKAIIESNPQLYLDEIRTEMARRTTKYWSTTILWRKLHKIGYSLKKAVLRAK